MKECVCCKKLRARDYMEYTKFGWVCQNCYGAYLDYTIDHDNERKKDAVKRINSHNTPPWGKKELT